MARRRARASASPGAARSGASRGPGAAQGPRSVPRGRWTRPGAARHAVAGERDARSWLGFPFQGPRQSARYGRGGQGRLAGSGGGVWRGRACEMARFARKTTSKALILQRFTITFFANCHAVCTRAGLPQAAPGRASKRSRPFPRLSICTSPRNPRPQARTRTLATLSQHEPRLRIHTDRAGVGCDRPRWPENVVACTKPSSTTLAARHRNAPLSRRLQRGALRLAQQEACAFERSKDRTPAAPFKKCATKCRASPFHLIFTLFGNISRNIIHATSPRARRRTCSPLGTLAQHHHRSATRGIGQAVAHCRDRELEVSCCVARNSRMNGNPCNIMGIPGLSRVLGRRATHLGELPEVALGAEGPDGYEFVARRP